MIANYIATSKKKCMRDYTNKQLMLKTSFEIVNP